MRSFRLTDARENDIIKKMRIILKFPTVFAEVDKMTIENDIRVCLANDSFPPLIDGVANTVSTMLPASNRTTVLPSSPPRNTPA